MPGLTSMRNIGREIEKKLQSIGIRSPDDLRLAGSKEAFLRLSARYPNLCLVHLYCLQGAIDDIEYNRLSLETRQDLKAFKDGLI